MNTRPSKTVVVIGGGVSGMALVYRLQKLAAEKYLPLRIKLFEASASVGGVLSSTSRDGFLLEEGPDCFLSEKQAALALAKELDLESQLIGTKNQHRRSFIYRKNKLHPVPEGLYLMAPAKIWPFLKSPLVNPWGKLRMSLDCILPPTRSTDDESLASFVRRRLGKQALSRIAQPLLAGIYTANPEELSLQATMPMFLEMEKKYGSVIRGLRKGKVKKGTSGPRYSLFVTFQKGVARFTQTLEKAIGPHVIQVNSPVQKLSKTNDGRWLVEVQNQLAVVADMVCLTVQSHQAAQFLRDLDPELSQRLGQTVYASTAVIHFAYERGKVGHPLNGMGFVVPADQKKNLLACSFSSQKFEGRVPTDQHVLLRAFVGGRINEKILEKDNKDLIADTQADLTEILKIQGNPLFSSITRWNKCMPQYAVGHLGRVAAIESLMQRHAGLYLGGNGLRGVGIPDVIQRSEEIAATLMDELSVSESRVISAAG